MKIHHQQGKGISSDRSERSGEIGRLGSDSSVSSSRSRQVGLDRIDVSQLGGTAAALVEQTMQTRQERISALAAHFQAGNYSLDLPKLSESILDHDSDIYPSYAG